ncbi:MAG: TIGR00645 family protein [Rhodospirillales bacterium]|jgi:uncharacterized protein (TIGR00645 family)
MPAPQNPYERWIERVVLSARWILVVFYLGLAVALAIYAVSFLKKLWKIAVNTLTYNDAEMLLAMLALIDGALVASLIVMVMISGYENFVSSFDENNGQERLSWIGKLDAGSLKIKVASAIVAISSIHLLQAFMNIGNFTSEQLLWLTIIHMVFVASALLLGVLDRMMNRKGT